LSEVKHEIQLAIHNYIVEKWIYLSPAHTLQTPLQHCLTFDLLTSKFHHQVTYHKG